MVPRPRGVKPPLKGHEINLDDHEVINEAEGKKIKSCDTSVYSFLINLFLIIQFWSNIGSFFLWIFTEMKLCEKPRWGNVTRGTN